MIACFGPQMEGGNAHFVPIYAPMATKSRARHHQVPGSKRPTLREHSQSGELPRRGTCPKDLYASFTQASSKPSKQTEASVRFFPRPFWVPTIVTKLARVNV